MPSTTAPRPDRHGHDRLDGWAARRRRHRPALARDSDALLFDQVWERTGLSERDRSLATVSSLVAPGAVDQLTFHLAFARDNGVTEHELIETITDLAFYAGWPRTMAAIGAARTVFNQPVLNQPAESPGESGDPGGRSESRRNVGRGGTRRGRAASGADGHPDRGRAESQWAAMSRVAELLGVDTAETARMGVRQAEVDSRNRVGTSATESAELRRLRRGHALGLDLLNHDRVKAS